MMILIIVVILERCLCFCVLSWSHDTSYNSVFFALFFFWLVGLGVVIGAELNAALAETPEEKLAEETDEGRRAALAREMEEEEHAG